MAAMVAKLEGETSPSDSWGRTVLYSSSQRSVSSRTWFVHGQ